MSFQNIPNYNRQLSKWKNRNTFSSWLLIAFGLCVSIASLMSVLFQAPLNPAQETAQYDSLITTNELIDITGMEFKNPIGAFNLSKNEEYKHQWKLTSPRFLPARAELLNSIFNVLTKAKVRKIYQYDPINISNFALNAPLISIKFTKQTGEQIQLKFGFVNPIDQSTYVLVEPQHIIYHIDAMPIPLEGLALSDFVESRIIAFQMNELASIKIYRSKQQKPLLEILRQDQQWVTNPRGRMEEPKITEYVKSLTEVKSHYIMDERNEDLDQAIKSQLTPPLYIMEIQDIRNRTYEFRISNVITKLPGIKVEEKQNLIIEDNYREHPYLVDKDFLQLLSL